MHVSLSPTAGALVRAPGGQGDPESQGLRKHRKHPTLPHASQWLAGDGAASGASGHCRIFSASMPFTPCTGSGIATPVVSAGNVLKIIEPGSLCCSHTNNYLSMEIPLTCRSQHSQVLPVSTGSSTYRGQMQTSNFANQNSHSHFSKPEYWLMI